MYTKIKLLTTAAVLFIGTTAHAQPQKVVVDKILAVVGDRIILRSDIDNAIIDIGRQGLDIAEDANCSLLQQALNTKLLLLQSDKDSVKIPDEEVEAKLDLIIRHFIELLGSPQAVEDYCGKTIYQVKDEARESIREQMLTETMQRKITQGVNITPTEVAAFFNRIPKDSLLFIESKFEVGQITITPKPSADMEQYIINELNNYKKQLENKAADFDQLAKLYSEHANSKKSGGIYRLNRNDKTWSSTFVAAVFRLKNGEISNIIRSDNSEFILVQMIDKRGDDADIRLILRTPPVTDADIAQARNKLDTIRSKIVAGVISFNEAASKYSERKNEKFTGPFLLKQNGSPYVTMRDMDNETAVQLAQMKVGDISGPIPVTIEENKKAVRIVYLKSRSNPHRMNLKDDYAEIAQGALEEKRQQALNNWIQLKKNAYVITIDEAAKADCINLQQYNQSDIKTF